MVEAPPTEPGVIYGVDQRPSTWWESLLYGWQHTLVDISPFVTPLAVASALSMSPVETAAFLNYGLVAMGIATLIQTLIGNRLPIVQGPSATLIATMAPMAGQLGAGAMWGAAAFGGLAEMALGASRLLGWLRRFLPPTVSGSVIVVIGLSLGQLAVRLSVGDGSARNWMLAGIVVAAVLVLQFALRSLWGGLLARASIFVTIWMIGLGLGSALGAVDWGLVAERPWFALPRLFPYGGPGFGWELPAAAALVVLVGYFGSMVESLGDYAATCSVAEIEYTPSHMNRGIFAEGLGSVIAAILGGLPCTSYSQNIGIIATTRIASRFVVQIAGGVLLLYGLCPKFGALLVAMPRSVLGGVFLLVCAMITISGLRLIGNEISRPENAFVVGTTLVVSLALPVYVAGPLAEWQQSLPAVAGLLVGNAVVLSVLCGVTIHLLVQGLLAVGPRPPG